MLINVMIIEVGGVMGATPQKYMLFICCNTQEAIAYLDFIAQNLKGLGHI